MQNSEGLLLHRVVQIVFRLGARWRCDYVLTKGKLSQLSHFLGENLRWKIANCGQAKRLNELISVLMKEKSANDSFWCEFRFYALILRWVLTGEPSDFDLFTCVIMNSWNLSFRCIHCSCQFTPKLKANAVPCLLSSLVWIDQYNEM